MTTEHDPPLRRFIRTWIWPFGEPQRWPPGYQERVPGLVSGAVDRGGVATLVEGPDREKAIAEAREALNQAQADSQFSSLLALVVDNLAVDDRFDWNQVLTDELIEFLATRGNRVVAVQLLLGRLVSVGLQQSIERESQLRSAAIGHSDATAALGVFESSVGLAWFRVQQVGTLGWLSLSLLLGILPPVVATSVVVFSTVPLSVSALKIILYISWAWAALAYGGLGIFTIRSRPSQQPPGRLPAHAWRPVFLLYAAVGLVFLGFLAFALTRPDLMSDVGLRLVWAALAASAVTVFALRRVLKERFQAEENEAELTLERQTELLSQEIDTLSEDVDREIGGIVSTTIGDLGGFFGVAGPDKWALTLPEYDRIVENSWKALSEQYDRLVKTPDMYDLLDDMKNLDTASIGIAGERGGGKDQRDVVT